LGVGRAEVQWLCDPVADLGDVQIGGLVASVGDALLKLK
jgi:hypothetical protein